LARIWQFKSADESINESKESPMSMDQKIVSSSVNRWITRGLVFAAVIGVASMALSKLNSGTAYTVDGRRIRIATVRAGVFEDYIPLRASVEPLKSVYLDAVDGGRVETVFVEEGAIVEQGQKLVELSNTRLELEILGREAEIADRLNNLRNTQLAIEQNRLALKKDLVEINYQIIRLERVTKRRSRMAKENVISQDELESAQDELVYWGNRREVAAESQEVDQRLREAQIEQLESSVEQLKKNLTIARKNLEGLLVKAPRSGKLTSFDLEVGEAVERGDRLGQVDDVDRFRAVAQVNEFYTNRVRLGQRASFKVNDVEYKAEIAKIYPDIKSGKFEVDLTFGERQPKTIRRGQTLQVRLQLGDQEPALLIDNGPFFQDTGGAWVFAIAEDGESAYRTRVKLGRRNPNAIEILEGLEDGDRVVVSEYSSFLKVDRLNIND
jgi:HlyD family secretion protein